MKFALLSTLFLLTISLRLLASESALYVQLEAIKNSIKSQGYSQEINKSLMELYQAHKSELKNYEDKQLKEEFVTLVRSSNLVSELKDCVDSGHEDIKRGIDNLFNSLLTGTCVRQVMESDTITTLISDTNKILDGSSEDSQKPSIQEVRKSLFESSLPGLLESFNNTRSLISDTDEKFLKDADQLFSRLPKSKRDLPNLKSTKRSSEDASRELLGPIDELYKSVYGDNSDLALSDRWKEAYTSKEGAQTPNIFSPPAHEVTRENTAEALARCLDKANQVRALQAKAKDRFESLRGLTSASGFAGLIPQDEKMQRGYGALGFSRAPECHALGRGLIGDHRMDRFDRALSQQELGDSSRMDDLSYSGKSIVLTLGKMGEDPNNVYKTSRNENLETRSFLKNYTASSIKEHQTKALAGMQDFINYMGRRVYAEGEVGLGKQALESAGDFANSLTSLGGSQEVDVALLLMSNPASGMNYLVNTPGAVESFCDSFKTLRNQKNVNQALEVASVLSMFTGVGGMFVKGGGLLAKGVRLSNFALTGADSLSMVDTITNARDIALSNACASGDEHLCESYMQSDRNFTMAITGLALNAGALHVGAARKLTSRFRGAFVLRNGENTRAMIADYEKLSSLVESTSETQRSALAKILANKNLSDAESAKMISLFQNNTNARSLQFLEQYSHLDAKSADLLMAKILEKANHSGGVCKF